MIYRLREPPSTSTTQKIIETPRNSEPDLTETEIESIEAVQVDSTQNIDTERNYNLPSRLSYLESSDDPFEEIVIRAETYFPGLTNIVRDKSRSYIVEHNTYEASTPSQSPILPPPQSALPPIPQPRRQPSRSNSSTHQNPFNSTGKADIKRQTEEDLERRIMMYSRFNRSQQTYYRQSYQPNPPLPQQVQQPLPYVNNCYSQQPLPNSYQQPPEQQEQEPDERTTYDYRDFQAARQRFEQHGSVSQPVFPQPEGGRMHRAGLRPQHSVVSTASGISNDSVPNTFNTPANTGVGMGAICPMKAHHRPPVQPFPQQPPQPMPMPAPQMSQEPGPLMKREPRNPFAGGCGCGPGSGCGNLPQAPIHRAQGDPNEAIKKYLVAEEVGPGGVKSVFSFPGGMEPSDLTLLRAAISANQPKDAFIPEENDDLEEQLNRQLEKVSNDPRSLQLVHTQIPQPQQQQQQQQPMPHHQQQGGPMQTSHNMHQVTRGPSGNNGMMEMMPQQSYSRQQQPMRPSLTMGESQANVRFDNPLDSLLYNGISNNFVGPNSQTGQMQGSSTYPMHGRLNVQHVGEPGDHNHGGSGGSGGGGWHYSSPPQQQQQHQHQPAQQMYTSFNPTRYDQANMGGNRGSMQMSHQPSTDRFMMG